LDGMEQGALEALGALSATLIEDSQSWIHRRRESVTILDEGALRRQLSVDFTLDAAAGEAAWRSAVHESFGESMAVAPLFFLEKRPAWLMNFDLKDERGQSLPLLTSAANAKVSSGLLKQLVRTKLSDFKIPFPPEMSEVLGGIAESHQDFSELWIRRLQNPLSSDSSAMHEASTTLWADLDLRWWFTTIADASLVLVAYEENGAARRIMKLSYDEPVGVQPKLQTRIGWSPFRTWLVSPWIEGERYHLEVTAPPGMRLIRAALADDEHPEPYVDEEVTRRAHLYVGDAGRAGGAMADLYLRVSGGGLQGGATLSALLVVLAIGACLHWHDQIAENSTTAPSLLLLLPAVIASYVGRPGQHPLTTHLLAVPRWLVLVTSGAAYYAAIRLGLSGATPMRAHVGQVMSRGEHIAAWLLPAFVLSTVVFLILAIGWLVSRTAIHRGVNRLSHLKARVAATSFTSTTSLEGQPTPILFHCSQGRLPGLTCSRADSLETDADKLRAFRATRWLSWAEALEFQKGPLGTTVTRRFLAKSDRLPRLFMGLYVWLKRWSAARRDRRFSAYWLA
jgi:hypothetical protein